MCGNLTQKSNSICSCIFYSLFGPLLELDIIVQQCDEGYLPFCNICFILVPCAILALLINSEFTIMEILWTFSIYLEAIAVLPQLFLLQRTGEVENLTGNYVFTLGGYRAFYLLNWIYRAFTDPGYRAWIVWIAGTAQTALYCDFFYYYLTSKWYGKKLTLPQ